MPTPIKFDAVKAIQAVAYLLRREPGHRMNYMRLLKVLYIAERELLRETGMALTGSPAVAMKRGPVLESVYGLIRSQHSATPEWSKYFQTVNYNIAMTADPGNGRLSRYMIRKLEEIATRHADDDEWSMVEVTHRLPEWIEHDPGESSEPIPFRDIVKAIGREQDYETIVANNQHGQWVRDFSAEDDGGSANNFPPAMSF